MNMLWMVGHSGQDEVLRVRISFQSRELNVLTEHVPDALKQSAMPKRVIEEVGGCGSIRVRAVGEGEEGYLTRLLEKL